jgi:tetratricopeptide (TPR) repeat protein/predicted Ser/Thr protein kinase
MSSLHKGAKDLFIAALEREGAERDAFLADACGHDTALREEVESLLRFHEQDSTGLPRPIPDAEPEPETPPRTFAPGFVFGMRYRMVTRLGRGGMGDVWRADDLMLETPVALKLIRSTSQAGRERLLQEVRLARRVTHPAVVRVFDVGEADDEVFFSMELIEGQDLATVLRHAGRLSPGRVVEIARQLCAGLHAAHSEGVLHRDLKPANVLVDHHGRVRITDFGIAVPRGASGVYAAGTPMYMAPEQRTPGASISPQTDLYALGVLLYELATGQHPTRVSPGGSVVPPSDLVPGINPALENVVVRALSVAPQDRPASAAAFAAMLPPGEQEVHALRGVVADAAAQPFWIRLWWIGVAAVLVLLVGLSTLLGPLARRANPPLTNLDIIVLADFVNTTNEPLFDGALKVALAVALEQSPFLKVFPDDRVQETLRLMERPPDQRITREVAREVAVREQLKATISGSIASLGRNYVLALEVVDAQTGDVMAREQVEAGSKEEVLTALGSAASALRERLGESLATLRDFDVPLPRATTPSLEALHAYGLAMEQGNRLIAVEAIPHLQRAIELDPNFALALAALSGVYANTSQTLLAPVYSKRAFELRDRVSEKERYMISWRYYRDALQDWAKGLELARAWTKAYPREAFAFNALGLAAELHGLRAEAELALRKAIELDPTFEAPKGNLADNLQRQNKLDDAMTIVTQSIAAGVEYQALYRVGYLVSLLRDNPAGMATYLTAARRTRDVLDYVNWEARAAAYYGRVAEGHDGTRGAIQQAMQLDFKEWAARYSTEDAEIHAIIGRCAIARRSARAALDWSRDTATLDIGARALGWCGDPLALELTKELAQRFPNASLRLHVSMPIVTAAYMVRTGNFAGALTELERVKPYEDATMAKLWPAFLRGQIYLARKEPARAAPEFQHVIDRRSESADSLLYPMALLGRARAAVAAGERATAEQYYEQLFEVWRNADPDLEPLVEARREAARLH